MTFNQLLHTDVTHFQRRIQKKKKPEGAQFVTVLFTAENGSKSEKEERVGTNYGCITSKPLHISFF